jgi:primosomal protein N'
VQGRILIQTFRPNEKVFEFVRCHDSEGFLQWQRGLREKSKMPPFSAIAKITFSHEKKEVAFGEAKKFFEMLKVKIPLQFSLSRHGGQVQREKVGEKKGEMEGDFEYHWAPAFFPRTHGKYHFHVFVHAPDKPALIKFLKGIEIPEESKVDIDPSSLL